MNTIKTNEKIINIYNYLLINHNIQPMMDFIETLSNINDIVDLDGNTLLHLLLCKDINTNIYYFNYLSKKIDINKKNNFGLTVIDFLFLKPDLYNKFIKHKHNNNLSIIDINIINTYGQTNISIDILKLDLYLQYNHINTIYYKYFLSCLIISLINKPMNKQTYKITYKIIKKIINYNPKMITLSLSKINQNIDVSLKLQFKLWKFILIKTEYYNKIKYHYFHFIVSLIQIPEEIHSHYTISKTSFFAINPLQTKLLKFVIKLYPNDIYYILPRYNTSLFKIKHTFSKPINNLIYKTHLLNNLTLFISKYGSLSYFDINLIQKIKPYLIIPKN